MSVSFLGHFMVSVLFLLVKDSFKVKISSLEKEYLRIHVPAPLDRGDGSLLVRYRLYGSSLKGLKIEVLYQDKLVAKSPYTLRGKVFLDIDRCGLVLASPCRPNFIFCFCTCSEITHNYSSCIECALEVYFNF